MSHFLTGSPPAGATGSLCALGGCAPEKTSCATDNQAETSCATDNQAAVRAAI